MKKSSNSFFRVIPLLVLGALARPFSTVAATLLPGDLAVTASGGNLNLSFPTASPNFYTVQISPDLVGWTNYPPGMGGDGTTKTVTLSNALTGSHGFYRLLIQSPTRLLLSQSAAFAILGYDCGGIAEAVSAGIGTNGYPIGVVNLSTTCSGSGRGGVSTTHRASAVVVWDLAGNVISATPMTNGVTIGPTTGSDGLGDYVYDVGSSAYLVVPLPAAPTGVSAVQSGDQFNISWTPGLANPASIVSSTLTATPVNSPASVLTATVTGSATSGVIATLQPQTTYQITVVNANIGGSGPPSAPVTVTTSPATVPPSAPTGVTASWSDPNPVGTNDTLIATWQAANPGNSPIDEYLITITGSDGGGTFTQTVSGTTLTAYFTVDYIPNWSVTVQAHNAAGWGPVSAVFNLGGL